MDTIVTNITQITVDTLRAICPNTPKNVDVFVDYLNKAFAKWGIDTKLRISMFLAQIAWESGSFRYTRELASGKAYEMRKDLGNVTPGDGVKYKGRGLIQITGRANYKALSIVLFKDENMLLNSPQLLETPSYAVESAAWFFSTHGCNELSDLKDIEGVTRKINGGLNGINSREAYYNSAISIIT